MPLTRYEIRNEHSLANPDLYRAAAKDDPEGLLEGVAMAALVGIVRQLGDLAEFAAEVFHDLHEEVLATASRGHELLIRVQQLEAEVPVVEKIMYAEINYVNYAYNPGVEWHATVCNDQNHFTQGDLPRFIRTAYEDCRGPPRLSELDKFDVAGDGACLKRYTDPSFFKMEWASSELMKAEREQLDKKARRIKKKARRYGGEVIPAMHMQPRLRHTLSEARDIASTNAKSPLLKPHHSPEHQDLGLPLHGSEHDQASARLMVPEQEILEHNHQFLRVPASVCKIDGTSLEAENIADTNMKSLLLKPCHSPAHQDLGLPMHGNEDQQASARLMVHQQESLENKQGSLIVPAQAPSDFKASVKLPFNDSGPIEITEEPLDLNDKPSKCAFVTTEVVNVSCHSSNVAAQKEGLHMSLKTSQDFADEFASEVDNFTDALTTVDSEAETDLEVNLAAEADPEFGPDLREVDASLQVEESHLKNTVEEGLFTENDSTSFRETPDLSRMIEPEQVGDCPQLDPMEENPIFGDGRGTSPSVEERGPGTPINWSSTSSPVVVQSLAVKSGEFTESESVEEVPETPNTPEAKESDDFRMEDLAAAFHESLEPAVPVAIGVQGSMSDQLGSLPFNARAQNNMLPTKKLFVEHSTLEDSESEHGEYMKESSPLSSSPNSSIQPMNWARDFSRSANNLVDSDDELDGMQVSFTSPSSNSSALSSPRPSTLATSVLNMDFDKEPRSPLSPHGSIKLFSDSLLGIRPQSAGSSSPYSHVSLMETAANFSTRSPHPVSTSSHVSMSSQLSALELFHQASSAADQIDGPSMDGFEHFPPPPPLPPIEWRMTKRSNAISAAPGISFQWSIDTSGIKSFAPQSIYVQPDGPLPALKPSIPTDHGSDDLCLPSHESHQLVGAFPAIDTVHVIIEDISKDSKSLLREPLQPSSSANTPDQLVQPLKAVSLGLPTPSNFPVMHGDLVKSSEPDMRRYSTSRISPIKASEPPLASRDAAAKAGSDDDEKISHACFSQSDSHLQAQSLDFSPPESQGDNLAAAVFNSFLADDVDEFCSGDLSLPTTKEEITPLSNDKEEEKHLVRSIPSPSPKPDSVQDLTPSGSSKSQRKDPLIAALMLHDKSMLKKVPEWSQSSRTARSDDREVLLEQIRTGSFSLRHTKIEKQEPPRPVTSINVAAILEKANAIRQAFAGSDDEDEDDDDWSD